MNQVEDNTMKIKGIAKSLDSVKADVRQMQSQIGEVKGIALSADRGFHILSDRQAMLQKTQDKMAGRMEYIAESINGIYKQNFKHFMGLIGFILSLVGVFFTAYKILGQ